MEKVLFDNRKNNNEISVVIPIYNGEKLISNLLKELADQTFKKFETVIVDDGSFDRSLEQIFNNLTLLENICVIYKKNEGAGLARNIGIKYCYGDYLIFLDCDDHFESSLLEELYNSIKINKSDMAICDAKELDVKNNKIVNSDCFLRKKIIKEEKFISPMNYNSLIFYISCAAPWNKLIKKELIDKNQIRFQNTHNSNDLSFVCKCIVSAQKICFTRKKLIMYSVGGENNLSGSYDKFPVDICYALLELKKYMLNKKCFSNYKFSFYSLAFEHIFYHYFRMFKKKSKIELTKKIISTGFFGILLYPTLCFRKRKSLKKLLILLITNLF